MNNPNKLNALEQIDAIYKTIQDNFNIAIYGPKIASIGFVIASIPFIEYIFSMTLDPMIATITAQQNILEFAIRTVFYWTLFYGISRIFEYQEKNITGNHLLRKKITDDMFFPIIPISTAIALLMIKQEALIMPIICIILGSQFLQVSKFTSSVIKVTAWTQILIGIISIILTRYSIAHLWVYTIGFYGITLIGAGLMLIKNQKNG